jgi:hypothetical protein
VIRLNLLRNRFHSASVDPELELAGSLATELGDETPSRGRKVWLVVAVLVLLAAAGGGVWYYLRPSNLEDIAPPTVVAKPKVDSTRKDTAKAATKDTARPKDTLHATKDSGKTESATVAEAPKPKPKPPEPKHEAVPTQPAPPPPPPTPPPPPPPPPLPEQPEVVAPALAGGVVNQVLSEAQTQTGSATPPASFEDLSAPARLSYQQFSFERILSVVRQVATGSIRFSRIRVYSPGLVVLQGATQDSAALRGLVQGLLAQSMVDTELKTGAKGQFALVARLPFSASFPASASGSGDFSKTIMQARDLAKSQNLELSALRGPSVQNLSGRKRAMWKVDGTGTWEGIDKWLSALQSTSCPLGLASLTLTSGPEGKLRMEADAISYSP